MKFFGWSAGFFFTFFSLGWLLSAQAPPLLAPPAPLAFSAAKAKKIILAPPQKREILLRGRGAPLFQALFDQQVLTGSNFAPMETALRARFQAAYSRVEKESQRELVSRLGILKALDVTFGEQTPPLDRAPLLAFYRGIAARAGEKMLVRRQALRNLSAWMKVMPEKERNEILARMPASLISSAALSEAELAEEIFSRAQ